MKPQAPRGLELSVNLKTAQNLGLNQISNNALVFAQQEGYKINVQ